MKRYRCQPFLRSDDMRDSHQVIIGDMREMIGRQAIGFDENDIVVIIYHIHFPSDDVVENDSFGQISRRTESDDKIFICL